MHIWIKKIIAWASNRLDGVEEKSSECKERLIEIIQTEAQEKQNRASETYGIRHIFKWSPDFEEKEHEESFFFNYGHDFSNFPNLKKFINPYAQ